MKTELIAKPSMETEKNPIQRSLLLLAIVSVASAFGLLLCIPVWHDESFFLHSAWLMSRGLQPYEDFFYNHPRLLVDVLNAYQWIVPDYGADVLWWGRLLCGFVLVATSWRIVQFSRFLGNVNYGLGAVPIYCLLSVVPYSPSNLRHHQFAIRPEVFAIPFVLWMIQQVLSWFATPQRLSTRQILLYAFLAAVPICLSARTGFVYAALTVLVVINARTLLRQHWICLGLTGILIIIYATAIHDFGSYYNWAFVFSGSMREPHAPQFIWFRANTIKFPMAICLLYAAASPWLTKQRSLRQLSFILLVLFCCTLFENSPGLQAWQYPAVISCLMLWFAVRDGFNFWADILSRRSSFASSYLNQDRSSRIVLKKVAVAIVVLVCVYYARGIIACVRFIKHPEATLAGQIDVFDRFCKLANQGTVLCVLRNNPIACHDASYLWIGDDIYYRIINTVPRFRPRPVDVYSEVLSNPPTFMKPFSVSEYYGAPELVKSLDNQLQQLISENYIKLDSGLLLRSAPEREQIQELLESKAGKIHFTRALQAVPMTFGEILESINE